MGRVVTIRVNGEDHSIDLSEELDISNPDAERHTTASAVAWWGVLTALARGAVSRLTAAAQHWHAAGLAALIQDDEKLSEWKAKAQVTGHETYLKMQHDIAAAQEVADKAEFIHWAFVRKMDMLKAMLQGEGVDKRISSNVGSMPGEADDPRLRNFRSGRKRNPQED